MQKFPVIGQRILKNPYESDKQVWNGFPEKCPAFQTDGSSEPGILDNRFHESLSSDRAFASNSAEYCNKVSELEDVHGQERIYRRRDCNT